MIYAKSGDSKFIARMEEAGFHGMVHSIFNRSVNIRCLNSEELYTIASCVFDNGPNTLIADFTNLDPYGINVSEKVYYSENRLCIGKRMTVSMDQAVTWSCALPEYPAESNTLEENLSILKHYVDKYGISGGMKSAYRPRGSFDGETSIMLLDRSAALIHELNEGQMESAIHAAKGLIGLGPGLTPSGDDFLVGIFTVMNLRGSPLGVYSTLCQEILKEALHCTNEISLAALKQAAGGQVRESIANLMFSLVYGTTDQLLSSLTAVLDIGSSSGTDIALGIYTGLQFCCQHEFRRNTEQCQ